MTRRLLSQTKGLNRIIAVRIVPQLDRLAKATRAAFNVQVELFGLPIIIDTKEVGVAQDEPVLEAPRSGCKFTLGRLMMPKGRRICVVNQAACKSSVIVVVGPQSAIVNAEDQRRIKHRNDQDESRVSSDFLRAPVVASVGKILSH